MKKSKTFMLALVVMTVLGFTVMGTGMGLAACPENIIGYWKLDKPNPGGGYKDDIKGSTGVGDGSLTTETGIIKNAAGFDGSTTKIDIPPHHAYNWFGTESFSIGFWVKTNGAVSPSSEQVVIGRDDISTGMQWWIGLQSSSGNASFYLQDADGNVANLVGVGASLSDGDWHYVMAVRDASTDENMLYVDGAVQGSSVTQAFSAGFGSLTSSINVGYLDRSPYYHFAGIVDEVALYGRALPQTEIQSQYTAGLAGTDYCGGITYSYAPYPDDTVALWHLDEAGGSTYVDHIGDHDGTGSADPSPVVSGRVNGAQSFNGTDQGIDVTASSAFGWLGFKSFSIECWVKTDGAVSPASEQVIIGRDDALSGMQWWVGLASSSGNASFYLQDPYGRVANLVGVGASLSDGNWHHVVAVRDAATDDNTLYVDGAVQGSSVNESFPVGFDSASASLNIGYLARSPFFRFAGSVDEVALYDRALEATEISSHYTAGSSGGGVQTLRPAPTADAGTDQPDIAEGSTVTLDGSASAPGYTGTTITYLWEQTVGTTVTLSDATAAQPTFAAPDVDAAGETLTFRLTVTASDGQSSTDTVSVAVTDATIGPVADAGDDLTVNEGDTVNLDGSGSTAGTAAIATYAWVQTDSTGVTPDDLTGEDTATPSFTAPQVDETVDLTFQLTVTDANGDSDIDTVVITVTNVVAPAGDDDDGSCFISTIF